jgi:ABC-type multidrug transport system fused ATPase/permease subunit
VLQALVLLPIPLIVQRAFDVAIPAGAPGPLIALGGAAMALYLAAGAATLLTRHVVLRHSKLAIRALREAAIRKLYEVSRGFMLKREPGDLHDRVVHESERVDIMTNAVLAEFGPAAAVATGLGLVLIWLNWRLFLLTLALTPLILAGGRLLGPPVRRSAQAFHKAFERFSQGIFHVLRARDLTVMRAAESWELARQRERLEALRRTSERMSWLVTAYGIVQQSSVAAASLVVLVVGGAAVGQGRMTLGELISFSAGLMLLRNPVNVMLFNLPRMIEGYQSLTALHGLLSDPDAAPYQGGRRVPPPGTLALQGASFQYDDRLVLHDVDLAIRSGVVTALVGANGSGKSTILNLLLGFYRPCAGRVLADGVPYDEVDIRELRRCFGIVPQEPILISGTVVDNLLYGLADVAQDEIAQALELADAADLVASLPAGLATEVGDGGVFLSGGQRQRIALARALLRSPRVLLLDEPTDHLDERSTARVLANLRTLPSRPAVLLISHRPETAGHADVTFHLEAGRIVAVEPAPAGGGQVPAAGR